MQVNSDLIDQVFFFNIGPFGHPAETYFEWRSKSYFKRTQFELNLTRHVQFKDIFFCITREDAKIVYIVSSKTDSVFTIAAQPQVQSSLLEAILEYLIEDFFETYDSSLLMTCYGEQCNIFDGFASTVKKVFKSYRDLDIIKPTLVTCKACNKTLKVMIRKSLVDNSQKPTTPIVYVHSGHSVLIYVDKNYKVRGAELVSISY
jgi:hypothetical protein